MLLIVSDIGLIQAGIDNLEILTRSIIGEGQVDCWNLAPIECCGVRSTFISQPRLQFVMGLGKSGPIGKDLTSDFLGCVGCQPGGRYIHSSVPWAMGSFHVTAQWESHPKRRLICQDPSVQWNFECVINNSQGQLESVSKLYCDLRSCPISKLV